MILELGKKYRLLKHSLDERRNHIYLVTKIDKHLCYGINKTLDQNTLIFLGSNVNTPIEEYWELVPEIILVSKSRFELIGD